MGGNYAPFFVKKIIEPKSDGTPAIIDNPRFTEKAISVVSKLNESIKVQQFYQNLKTNNTSTISDEDYKKYSSQLFDNIVNQYVANGATQGQAIQKATEVLLPSLSTNRPIPKIKQILNRTIDQINLSFLDLKFQRINFMQNYLQKINMQDEIFDDIVRKYTSDLKYVSRESLSEEIDYMGM